MTPTVTAFEGSPDGGKVQAREMGEYANLSTYVARGEARPSLADLVLLG